MDITEAFGLEFLDLSEVDEYERNRVLASLQPTKLNADFPWIIGDKSTLIGTKSTKLRSSSANILPNHNNVMHQPLPHHSISNHGYPSSVSETTLTRLSMTVIHPENGLPIPVSNSLPRPINNPYYNNLPPSQYYPQAVATTISSIPVPIPQNYGNYSVPNTNNEIPMNPAVYPYIPLKSSVFYGVPPSQSIFVSHPSTVDARTYYQNAAPQYIQHGSACTTDQVQNRTASESVPVPQNKWGSTGNTMSNNVDVEQNESILGTMQSPNAVSIVKETPISQILSAETPAFTPKNLEKPPELAQSPPVSSEILKNYNEIPKVDSNLSTYDSSFPKISSTLKSSGPWGANKTWASLFKTEESSASSSKVNGLAKPQFGTDMNQESNSNALSCPFKNPKRKQIVDPDCFRMGEFLTNYTVDGRAVSLQPRGLINQSNYCYINSILQALIACPPMYNLLSRLSALISSNEKKKPTPVIDGICQFVREFKHLPANMRVNNRRSEGKNQQKKDQGALINTDIPFEPSWIYKMLNGLRTDLIEGRQEDAEEFLGCLLNNLNDEMLELIKLIRNEDSNEETPEPSGDEEDKEWQVMGPKNKGSVSRKTVFERTPISDIFGGSLKSKIHRTGDQVTENTQPFLTLQLNIEKVKTVNEALEGLTTRNQLEGITSSKTNEEIEAWQQVMLDELPVVLVLHLKCFDFKLDGCTKIVKALEFPIDLKIDTKLLSSKINVAKEKQYKLFAVVYHDGKEATKGHYITDAFHVGYSSWLRYDDASVKQVQEENVLKPQGTRVPYLLFYRRSDTIRSR